jgi:hypothetical protein
MQTFLPYRDFVASAKALDNRRLGKQRVETLQLLRSIVWPEYGWKNHPASKMWRGYEQALVNYGRAVCVEWIARGYKDTCLGKIAEFSQPHVVAPTPAWLTEDLCRSHQSNLIRKDPIFYGPKFPDVPDNLPYIWPS